MAKEQKLKFGESHCPVCGTIISRAAITSSKKTTVQEAADIHGKANFGKYPADYNLASSSMFGFPELTLNKLFGAEAPFSSSLQGVPIEVTLEKSSGTAKEFSAHVIRLFTEEAVEGGNL